MQFWVYPSRKTNCANLYQFYVMYKNCAKTKTFNNLSQKICPPAWMSDNKLSHSLPTSCRPEILFIYALNFCLLPILIVSPVCVLLEEGHTKSAENDNVINAINLSFVCHFFMRYFYCTKSDIPLKTPTDNYIWTLMQLFK